MYDEINTDIKTSNNEISEMFTKQDEGIKDIAPCLVSLDRVHKNNFDLLEPIEHLTHEVIHAVFLHISFVILLDIIQFLFCSSVESFDIEYNI